MDISDLKTTDDVYTYLRRLIIEMPQSYDLAHKILSLRSNKNYTQWSLKDKNFDQMMDYASSLELSPGDLMSWVRLKTLIV